MSEKSRKKSAAGYLALRDLRRYFTKFGNLDNLKLDDGDAYVFDYDKANIARHAQTTLTAYRIPSSKEYYDLQSLVFFLKNIKTKTGDYFRQAHVKGLKAVKFNARKAILEYLSGKTPDEKDKNVDLVQKDLAHGKKPQRKSATKRVSTTQQDTRKRQKLMKQWSKRENELNTINSILRCKNNIAKEILDEYTAFLTLKEDLKDETPRVDAKAQGARSLGYSPIIIVPSTHNSIINASNIKLFLERGQFDRSNKAVEFPIHEQEIRKKFKTMNKIDVPFRLISNVNQLDDDDWNHVVCAFVHGASWEFKQWKWHKPAEVFSHMLGVHVFFKDEKLNPEISSWNVKTFALGKQQNNQDQITRHKIWEAIETFVRNNPRRG